MKHFGKRLFAFLCALALLASLSAAAFADGEGSSAAERGLAAIEATGDQKYITLPKDEDYLESFKTRYVDFSHVLIPLGETAARQMIGASAPVERDPDPQKILRMPYAYFGTTVTVVAEQEIRNRKMDCILYRSSENQMRAGWIWDIYLGDEYPGKTLTIGTENSSAAGTVEEVPMTWSRAGFLGGQQNYSVLAEPVENCVGFTLDYQLIQENTDLRETILGPRTVYVNDGSRWIEAGSFDYSELGPVRVRVNLEEPVDIVAIGTIADCLQPNLFRFRQFACDYSVAG